MKSAQKIFGFTIVILAAFAFSASGALAAQVTNYNITLTDTRPTTSNYHTHEFTHTQAATLETIIFRYCTQPGALTDSCSKPAALITSAAAEGSLTNLTPATWTLDNSGTHPRLETPGAGEAIGANTPISIELQTITNHDINDCNPASNISTDTCYVRLGTYSDDSATTLVDEGLSSYTVVADVTVRARVDPTFTFVVTEVAADQVNNQITTSVASTYNTLNFGNLTAGTPKYTAHQLNVTTNTENGYYVYMKLRTGASMTGVYTDNNIDPFDAPGVGWSTPQAWIEPTGSTPNDNTGWLGANTTDTDVTGWSASPQQKFGPVEESGGTGNAVMYATGSDNGSTAVYVTYGLEVNVFQPADTYTGYLQYNAVPTY